MPTEKLQQLLFEQLQDQKLFETAADFINAYLANQKNRDSYPSQENLNKLTNFEENLPKATANSQQALAILEQLQQYGSINTCNYSSGKYYGFVMGGTIPIALAARLIADSWDQNPALFVMSPIAAKLEEICQNWILKLLNLDNNFVVSLMGGTSIATLTALATARYHLYQKLNWNLKKQGLYNAPKLKLIITEHTHSSVVKAANILGFGSNQITTVATDIEGRIIVDKLPALDDHSIICLQAGDVKTGCFDDFRAIGNIANKNASWLHIDGAFGLWCQCSAKLKHLTLGIELADSIATDAHKTLNCTYDSGILICKHQQSLVSIMSNQGSYVNITDTNRNSINLSPEMSKRARSIELWALLKFMGADGIQNLVELLYDNTQYLAKQLTAITDIKILNKVHFNQLLISANTQEKTNSLLDAIQQSNEFWAGSCDFNGEQVIRLSLCSWTITQDSIDAFVKYFNLVLSCRD